MTVVTGAAQAGTGQTSDARSAARLRRERAGSAADGRAARLRVWGGEHRGPNPDSPRQLLVGERGSTADELDNARRMVIECIDQVADSMGADRGRVYLAGFSQGAMLTLAIALTEPEKMPASRF